MRLGTVMRRWRLMEERTLRNVAKEIGVSAATLMRFEQGQDLSGTALHKILLWLLEANGV